MTTTGELPRWRQPGWPLAAIFCFFPLWWAMGMSEFICVLMAIPMGLHLVRQHRVQVPRGFGAWLLFLIWVVAGVLVLQVSAVGAVADSSSTRYLTWAYRLGWYLTVTVTLLYVISTRREFSATRVARIMSALFLTVAAGGLLGVASPLFEFPSLLEIILPSGITNIQFIEKMIHPSAAQLQDVLGYEAPRPSAPYAFTNTWGLNFVCTLPFFILGWCQRDSGWRRYLAPVVLALAAIPAIYSINRGMWLALIVMALFVAIRGALTGKPGVLLAVIAGGCAVVMLVAFTSLGAVVTTRLNSKGSEEGRTNLGTLAVTSVAATSPLIGLGSTRNVQGNFNTITGGASVDCPRCSPPALGTQGQLWLVVFSQGILGLILYLGFFATMFFRHLGIRSATATASLAVLVASVVTMPVYNSLGTGLMVTMVAVALLVREGIAVGVPEPLLEASWYSRAVIRWWPLVAACTAIGLAGGVAWSIRQGREFSATTTIVLPVGPSYASAARTTGSKLTAVSDGPMSMDTIGQLLDSGQVLDAVGKITGKRPITDDGTLSVRATPNSRTLHVSVRAKSREVAGRSAQAAASAMLALRQEQLDASQKRQIATLSARASSLREAITSLDEPIAAKKPGRTATLPIWATFSLRDRRAQLLTEQRVINDALARASAALADSGMVIKPTAAKVRKEPRTVAMASGLTLGLGIGCVLALWAGRRGRRILGRRQVPDGLYLPVLARMQVSDIRDADPATATRRSARASIVGAVEVAVQVHDFGSCFAASERDGQLVQVAGALSRLPAVRRSAPDRCVVLARPQTRSGAIRRVVNRAAAAGQVAIGVIIVEESAKGRWLRASQPMLDRWIVEEVYERNLRVKNGQ